MKLHEYYMWFVTAGPILQWPWHGSRVTHINGNHLLVTGLLRFSHLSVHPSGIIGMVKKILRIWSLVESWQMSY